MSPFPTIADSTSRFYGASHSHWNVQEGDVLRLGKRWIMLRVFSSLPIFSSGLSNFTISCRHITAPKGPSCSVSRIYLVSNPSRYIIRQPFRKFHIIIIHFFRTRSTSLRSLLTHSATVVRENFPRSVSLAQPARNDLLGDRRASVRNARLFALIGVCYS